MVSHFLASCADFILFPNMFPILSKQCFQKECFQTTLFFYVSFRLVSKQDCFQRLSKQTFQTSKKTTNTDILHTNTNRTDKITMLTFDSCWAGHIAGKRRNGGQKGGAKKRGGRRRKNGK